MQVRLVTEIAAIKYFLYHLTSDFFLLNDALVNPVPDETAKHARMGVDLVPILLKIAKRVAHTVSVLTGQNGTRTTIGANPRTAIASFVGDFQKALPTGVFGTLFI